MNATEIPVNQSSQSIKCSDEPGDATWILTSAFIIFTMQSGFGLLEAGMVSQKNEVNIMVKNAVDVIFGGLGYWLFGYGLSFGTDEGTNFFTGVGNFLTDASEDKMGEVYSKYIFQMSFSTTATTIVSGAMAERTNLKAYMVYSFLNTLSYCFPAHWMWAENGFLKQMGAVDVAGCAPVHTVGGVSALVATLWLKPRHGKFSSRGADHQMASPTNVMLGAFMLWWGWLGFNCGSTFGISGNKWKLASRAAVVTINGSIGGSLFGIIYSYFFCKKFKGKLGIPILVTGLLGGLVGVTGICALCKPWEGLVIGFIGGVIAVSGNDLIEKMKIDDPVGCISTHFFTGVWGLLAVALFVEHDKLEGFSTQSGVLKGGAWGLFAAQFAAIGSVAGWTIVVTVALLFVIDKTIGLRVNLHEEVLGADWCEHGIAQIPGQDNVYRPPYGRRLTRSRSYLDRLSIHDNCLSSNGIINEGSDIKGIYPEDKSKDTETEIGKEICTSPRGQTDGGNSSGDKNTAYLKQQTEKGTLTFHQKVHGWFCIKNTTVKVVEGRFSSSGGDERNENIAS